MPLTKLLFLIFLGGAGFLIALTIIIFVGKTLIVNILSYIGLGIIYLATGVATIIKKIYCKILKRNDIEEE